MFFCRNDIHANDTVAVSKRLHLCGHAWHQCTVRCICATRRLPANASGSIGSRVHSTTHRECCRKGNGRHPEAAATPATTATLHKTATIHNDRWQISVRRQYAGRFVRHGPAGNTHRRTGRVVLAAQQRERCCMCVWRNGIDVISVLYSISTPLQHLLYDCK